MTRGLRIAATLTAAALGVAAVACAQDDDGGPYIDATVFNVQARDGRFEPDELRIPADTEVRLQMVNHDEVEHDFVVDEIDIDLLESDLPEGHTPGDGIDLHTQVDETQSIVFRAAEAGSYEFYCSVPGHREAGMAGTLTVEDRDAR